MILNIPGAGRLQSAIESDIRVLFDHSPYDNILALIIKGRFVLASFQTIQSLRAINIKAELSYHRSTRVHKQKIARTVLKLLASDFEQLLVTDFAQFSLMRRETLENRRISWLGIVTILFDIKSASFLKHRIKTNVLSLLIQLHSQLFFTFFRYSRLTILHRIFMNDTAEALDNREFCRWSEILHKLCNSQLIIFRRPTIFCKLFMNYLTRDSNVSPMVDRRPWICMWSDNFLTRAIENVQRLLCICNRNVRRVHFCAR